MLCDKEMTLSVLCDDDDRFTGVPPGVHIAQRLSCLCEALISVLAYRDLLLDDEGDDFVEETGQRGCGRPSETDVSVYCETALEDLFEVL